MPEQPDLNPGDEVKPGTEKSGEHICPACSGSGELDGARCKACGGTGRIIALVGDA